MFISHDHRDAAVAEAFSNLLLDASGGFVNSFRSSDNRGTTGIEFGAEWYETVMERLENATDVVALLTENSIDRPWILYEAGVAKGKLNKKVLGIALGVPLEAVSRGPFALFQNSDGSAEALTKLVLQLIRRDPLANPREEAVHRSVEVFLKDISAMVPQHRPSASRLARDVVDPNAVTKLFEEMKVIVSDIPKRVEERTRLDRPVLRMPLHSRAVEPLLRAVALETGKEDFALLWAAFAAALVEASPWFAPFAERAKQALAKKSARTILQARRRIELAADLADELSREVPPSRRRSEEHIANYIRIGAKLLDDHAFILQMKTGDSQPIPPR